MCWQAGDILKCKFKQRCRHASLEETWKRNKAESSAGGWHLPKVVNQVVKQQKRNERGRKMWGKYPKIFSVDILAQNMAVEDVCVCERNFFPK